jgi:hypothetical protein
MSEKYYSKIKKSNLYNFLRMIEIGELTFSSEEEKKKIIEEKNSFFKSKCPYDISYEKIKYSIDVLCFSGYENMIDNYLNISKNSFSSIYKFVIPSDLPVNAYVTAKINVKIFDELSEQKITVNVAYDYMFYKFYGNIDKNNFIDLANKKLFSEYDEFKKNYI